MKLVASMSWVEGSFWVMKFPQLLVREYLQSLAKSCVLLGFFINQNWWPRQPPGQYRANTWPLVAFSGFALSPGPGLLGNAHRITLVHWHGHQNGQRLTCMFCYHQFFVAHNCSWRPCYGQLKIKLVTTVLIIMLSIYLYNIVASQWRWMPFWPPLLTISKWYD